MFRLLPHKGVGVIGNLTKLNLYLAFFPTGRDRARSLRTDGAEIVLGASGDTSGEVHRKRQIDCFRPLGMGERSVDREAAT